MRTSKGTMIDQKISALEAKIQEKEHEMGRIRSEYQASMSDVASSLKDSLHSCGKDLMPNLLHTGEDWAKAVLRKFKDEIKVEPGSLISKVALYSFSAGLLLSTMRKRSKRQRTK